MNPLQKAVIADDLEAVKKLKDSEWRFESDPLGFTPYELAQVLGKSPIEALFAPLPELSFKVQFPKKPSRILSKEEFQEAFGVVYRPYLTFPSYDLLQDVVRCCPYLLRFPWLTPENYLGGARYQRRFATGFTAPIVVKWIDDVMGWGVFADVDLPENTFVGEYTGIVRRLYRSCPDHNGYCFHYPTKFWSWNYFTVDSLQEGNAMRFLNHSDHPNLKPYCFIDRRLLHMCFLSACGIKKGEQLFYDYGKDYWIRRKKREDRVY
jgi:uncharacterized protein